MSVIFTHNEHDVVSEAGSTVGHVEGFTIKIKPMSTNSLFRGRRFRTKAYDEYEKEVWYQLPDSIKVPEGKISLKYLVGLFNKNADMANVEKAFTDILQKKLGFNDKNIYKLEMERTDVSRGDEFISFEIKPWNQK